MWKVHQNGLKIMRTAYKASFALLLSIAMSSSLLADDSLSLLQSAFKSHCNKCHGKSKEVEGDVNLLALRTGDDLLKRPELLEDLIAVLKDREMPPEDEPPLPDATRKQMVSQLQTMLAQALKTQAFVPTPIRRMSWRRWSKGLQDN